MNASPRAAPRDKAGRPFPFGKTIVSKFYVSPASLAAPHGLNPISSRGAEPAYLASSYAYASKAPENWVGDEDDPIGCLRSLILVWAGLFVLGWILFSIVKWMCV